MNSKSEEGVDLKSDAIALQRLKEAAEKAKIESSLLLLKLKSTYHISPLLQLIPKHLVKNIDQN